MIATLSGKLFLKQPNRVIIDVHGVGYDIVVSSRTYEQLPATGEETFLYIHTNVREDAIVLFGFDKLEEKELYLLLNTVSGVGPKLAMAILSSISVAELSEAISRKDLGRLSSLSGVGKKTAQRLCVELQDKLELFFEPSFSGSGKPAAVPPMENNALQDAASALINLGYPQQTAWQALRIVQQKNPTEIETIRVEELIRRALRALA